ncbi:hypothetical protein Q5H92_14680 [Hymenobacter sp. M29]|uniref:Uncharacterized protein n=1 Tax=Hymenobacter mellowenesis TaxID=3063995 RepID=A0ABT9AF52_9BACT|nr:hypothetical protein [Hymenobacter sp. M29]MDO7847611.1 hypothetical protein [Hymenobacter sp. M29]
MDPDEYHITLGEVYNKAFNGIVYDSLPYTKPHTTLILTMGVEVVLLLKR